MTEMDQSRFTTEEQAFLQALDDQAREFQENATAFARQLGEDFAECLRIIRRLAGDRPPADSIRVGTCDTCGRTLRIGYDTLLDGSHSPSPGGTGWCPGRVYVPAGDKPDRLATAARHRLLGYDDGQSGTTEDLERLIENLTSDVRSYASANAKLHSDLQRLRAGAEPDREAMVERAADALASIQWTGNEDDVDERMARAVVDKLYPPKP